MGSVQRAFALNEASTEFRKLWEGENLQIGSVLRIEIPRMRLLWLMQPPRLLLHSLKAFQARQTPQWKPSKL